MPAESSVAQRWRYRAADAAGREQRGDIMAASAGAALDELRGRALWVIDLVPEGDAVAAPEAPVSANWFSRQWQRWSDQEAISLAVITRALATLLRAGVPVDRALQFAADTPSGGAWRRVFGAVQQEVRAGSALSAALSGQAALPATFAPAIAVAESTGTLGAAFDGLAAQLEREGEIRARIRTALVYPSLLALSSVVGTLVILLVVVPRFSALITDAGATLPLSTRLLVAVSSVLVRGAWLLPLLALALGWGWRATMRDAARRAAWQASLLRWPVVGALLLQRDAARYLGTLALALESGVALLPAMALARATVGNGAMAARLAPAEGVVRDGGRVADGLSAVLPPLATELLRAGEAAGQLASLSRRAADAADAAAQRTLTRLVTLIEPVMILGFGGVVAFVALALLQAIYSLNAASL
jgi:type II secretory pathway component PulF